jgi:hypothetical protein
MTQIFYEDEFVFIEEDLEKSFVHYCYKENAQGHLMTEEPYKRSMLVYGNQVNQNKHTLLLVNTLYSKFAIVPELQEWTAKEVAPLTMSLKKMAFVLSPDIFSQVSLEQMMDEEGISDKYDKPMYFDNLAEAEAWLFAK